MFAAVDIREWAINLSNLASGDDSNGGAAADSNRGELIYEGGQSAGFRLAPRRAYDDHLFVFAL